MDLEETLARVVELGQEKLRIVRKRAAEQTPARDHAPRGKRVAAALAGR